MNKRGSSGDETLIVALDGDKLGQIGGTALALVVMAVCFYWRETDAQTALLRCGWAFVAGYGATFLMARVILRTSLFEMLEAEALEAKTPAKEKSPAEAADVSLDQLGLKRLPGTE